MSEVLAMIGTVVLWASAVCFWGVLLGYWLLGKLLASDRVRMKFHEWTS